MRGRSSRSAIAGLAVFAVVPLAACSLLNDLGGYAGDAPEGGSPLVDAPSGDDDAKPDAPPGIAPDAGPFAGRYRTRFTITNASPGALASNLPVCFVVAAANIAALVAAGKARADLADVRVSGPLSERSRVLDPRADGDTTLCFRLDRAIAVGATDDGYFLRYGDPNAGVPPPSEPDVFPFFDGFDGSTLAPTWASTGSPHVTGGNLVLPKGAASGIRTNPASDAVPLDASLEMRVKISDPSSSGDTADGGTGFFYWFGFQHLGDFEASEPWTIFVARGKSSIQPEHKTTSGLCKPGCDAPPGSQSSAFRVYRIDRAGDLVRFATDDGVTFSATGSNGDMSIMIRSFMPASDVLVDWVRARSWVTPEPTLGFGSEETVP